MRKNHSRLLNLLAIVAATSTPLALADRWSGKWFEVEVILLSQLEDKTKIREHFDESKPLPKYRRFYDLLSPYLQPDITSLKQVLPLCSEGIDPLAALAKIPSLPPIHQIKTLEEIEQLPVLPKEESGVDTGIELPVNEYLDAEPPTGDVQDPQLSHTDSEPALIKESNDLLTGTTEEIISEGLSAEQQEWLIAAEQALDPIQYTYNSQLEDFPSSFCTLSRDEFNQLDVNPARYSYDGFLVDEMPRWINGTEDINSTQPYLLRRESLKLRDIVTQLTRSKNFRPILHLGWRQPAYQLNRATPVRLSAGSNLQGHFVKQLEQYLTDKAVHEQEEAALASIIGSPDASSFSTVNQIDDKTQLASQHISSVLQQLSDISPGSLSIENLASIGINTLQLDNQETMVLDAPKSPAQPWHLDGFFRIHLHQNFLNITADFNIMNLTLSEQATQALKPNNNVEVKPIHFSQTRRIISREIHYFDHPYMGMIVQVRRYNKPTEEMKTDTDILSEE